MAGESVYYLPWPATYVAMTERDVHFPVEFSLLGGSSEIRTLIAFVVVAAAVEWLNLLRPATTNFQRHRRSSSSRPRRRRRWSVLCGHTH